MSMVSRKWTSDGAPPASEAVRHWLAQARGHNRGSISIEHPPCIHHANSLFRPFAGRLEKRWEYVRGDPNLGKLAVLVLRARA